MSYNLEINKPTNKSCQLYFIKNSWEMKHIIGKNQRKIDEFKRNEGITNIIIKDDYNFEYHGILEINGNPNAVNKLKREISDWLLDCEKMSVGVVVNNINQYDNAHLRENGLLLQGYEINVEEIIRFSTRFRKYLIEEMNEDINIIESKYINYNSTKNNCDIKSKTLFLVGEEIVKFESGIPELITHLKIKNYDNSTQYRILDYLPNTITHLTLYECEINDLDNLPNSIKYLEITQCFNNNEIKLNNLPNSIEVLKIDECVKKINKFPKKLNKIYFDYGVKPKHKLRVNNKILKLFYGDDNNFDEKLNCYKYQNIKLVDF